jgi:acetyl esterase
MEQLRGLLLTLIQLAENEVLRDEGEAYARELDDAGADVTNVRYNGTIHDFALLNALLDVPSTGTALREAATDLATTSADVRLGWPLTSRRTTGATTE